MSLEKDVAKIVVRSAIGGHVLSAIYHGKQHIVHEHSTVQELINDAVAVPYQPDSPTIGKQECEPYSPEDDVDNIELGYICIGINGHRSVTDANGIATNLPVEHLATHCGLYQIVPFAVKPLDNDLSDEQRRRFRGRKVLRIDGELYAAYYLRKLDTAQTPSSIILNQVDNGVKTSTIWKPTINDLRPSKPNIGYQNDASYITVASNLSLTFDEDDIAMYLEACELLFGHRHYAITEIGCCTGVDKPIVRQYPASGGQTPSNSIRNRGLKEVVATQIAYFVSTELNPAVYNKRFTWSVDLGINDPLFSKT